MDWDWKKQYTLEELTEAALKRKKYRKGADDIDDYSSEEFPYNSSEEDDDDVDCFCD